MGKKYVVMEVKSLGDNFIPANTTCLDNDYTRIDSRHVIDGDRLRWAKAKKGETVLDFGEAMFVEAPIDFYERIFILDPPKPEGDEWERWKSTMPLRATGGIKRGTSEYYAWIEEKLEWLAQMPRGK